MGLASKIKNGSSAPSTTPQHPQPQQYAASLSAPVYAYPPPPQRYGAAPPAQYVYPQHVSGPGFPSAPPFTEPQLYSAGDLHRHSHVESTPYPYGVQGKTPPYAGQVPISPSYQEQVQTPSSTYGVFSHVPRDTGQGPISPSYREQVQAPSSTYGVFSHVPRDAGQGPISPSYREQVQTPYGVLSHVPHDAGAQMQPAASIEMLAHKLQAIIQVNGLQQFYDPGRFQATLKKIAYINFAEIAAQWNIGIELAYDLAPLALYDIVFYCDDSGSMAFEENGERIDDLKLILSKVSDIATKFDDDGIIVRFMNSDVKGDGICNAADVANLISQVRFSGMTPLGTNLDRKVIQPFVLGQAMSNMAKPVLAIIITDGEPSGEDHGTLRQVIQHAKDALARTRYGGGAFAVQIAQVGKDARTQKFLESLDKDPGIGGMIDCTSYYELEEEEFARKGVALTPELWLLKMCVGAIDPEYDSKDD